MIVDVRDACTPRSDVLKGGLEDKHFAAQLDQVVLGASGYEAYADAEQFFALTYPTQGLKHLLASTFSRLNPPGGGRRHPKDRLRPIPTRGTRSTAMRPHSGAARLTA